MKLLLKFRSLWIFTILSLINYAIFNLELFLISTLIFASVIFFKAFLNFTRYDNIPLNEALTFVYILDEEKEFVLSFPYKYYYKICFIINTIFTEIVITKIILIFIK